MGLPSSFYELQQVHPECMTMFELIGFDQFFKMKPCEVNTLRVHKLMTSLQEDGTCQLTHKDGEVVDLNLYRDIVTKELKLKEGNNPLSSMKLTDVDRSITFKIDKVGEGFYDVLREQVIGLPLQIYQQYFHIYKAQKHTHLDAHMAYTFVVAHRRNKPLKGD